MEQLSFKQGQFNNLQKNTAIDIGDLCFCTYEDQYCDNETDSIGTIAICNQKTKQTENFTFIMPPPGKPGRILCTNGLNKGPEYLSNIILGNYVATDSDNNEIGRIQLISEKGNIGIISPPSEKNSTNVWQVDGDDSASYWPMYVADGIMTNCDTVLGDVNKSFSGMYLGDNTGDNTFGDWHIEAKHSEYVQDTEKDIRKELLLTDYQNYVSLKFSTIPVSGEQQYDGKIQASFQFDPNDNHILNIYTTNSSSTMDWAWPSSDNPQNKFNSSVYFKFNGMGFDGQQMSFDVCEEYLQVSLDSSTFLIEPSLIKLAGNICLESEYSYSSYPPTDFNCPLPNRDKLHKGQIYFTLLS